MKPTTSLAAYLAAVALADKSNNVSSLRVDQLRLAFRHSCRARARGPRLGGLTASALSGVSPWAPGSWQLTLDFGREENDSSAEAISKDWGADNGRLALSFDFDVTADVPKRIEDSSVESLWLGGKPTGSIECILEDGEQHCATYINSDGQQRVQIADGLWRIEPPLPLLPTYTDTLAGQSSTLRFYLTMKSALARNSINLPENQLLFLQANTFREEEYFRGIRTLLPYESAKDDSQRQLEEQLDHDGGDRRLDGSDLVQTLEGYRDMTSLVLEREEKRARWMEVKDSLPRMPSVVKAQGTSGLDKLLDDDDRFGVWPGDTALLTIERGAIYAVVREERTGLLGFMQDGSQPELIPVGTWKAAPLFEDDFE